MRCWCWGSALPAAPPTLFALIPLAAVGALLLGRRRRSRRLATPVRCPALVLAGDRGGGRQSPLAFNPPSACSPAAPARSFARRCCAAISNRPRRCRLTRSSANRPPHDVQLQGSSLRGAATPCSSRASPSRHFSPLGLPLTSSRAVAAGQQVASRDNGGWGLAGAASGGGGRNVGSGLRQASAQAPSLAQARTASDPAQGRAGAARGHLAHAAAQVGQEPSSVEFDLAPVPLRGARSAAAGRFSMSRTRTAGAATAHRAACCGRT